LAGSLDELAGCKEDVSWGVFPLKGQDVLYVASNGGGGYLDPLARDPEAVLNDVRNRIISRKVAREIYGTVVTDELVLDAPATAKLRRSLVSGRAKGAAPT
jgi:N-methylhydantoinase B